MTCRLVNSCQPRKKNYVVNSSSDVPFCCFFYHLFLLCLVEMNILIALSGESGVVYAVKLYPAGATTNSQDGVTDLFGKCLPVLEEMVKQNMPLLVMSLILIS